MSAIDRESGREIAPIGPQGAIARVEFWLRKRGIAPRLVRFLAWLDERSLG